MDKENNDKTERNKILCVPNAWKPMDPAVLALKFISTNMQIYQEILRRNPN
jgi:hypothetical protein